MPASLCFLFFTFALLRQRCTFEEYLLSGLVWLEMRPWNKLAIFFSGCTKSVKTLASHSYLLCLSLIFYSVTLGKDQLFAAPMCIRGVKPDNSFAKHRGSSRQVPKGRAECALFVAMGCLYALLLISSGGLSFCGCVPRCIFKDKKDS